MEPDHRQTEDKRKELGRSDEPVEDELVEEFENTVTEGADRLNRTWRALVITGLFGGIDVGLGIMAMLAVKEATGSELLAGMAFGIGLFALRLAHSELFTEDFLIPINAVVARHGTWLQLVRLWAVTLVTNLAGGWLFMWVVAAAFPQFEQLLLEVSLGYLEDGLTLETAALAVLAGSTITLSTRMSQGTGNDVVTALISLISGLLVVGLGMLHGALNSIVVFGAMHQGAAISYTDWFVWFLWVIPLNMLGGLVIITLPRLVRTLELIRKERAEQGEKIRRQEQEQERAGGALRRP
ncbi:formate/nitrite transporter family protein [Kocuria sp. LUK]|uniref:formate/nitrite transporter family protein n=1 Tax=Kocuria sp. LUK TaxID=2897828 RepID=UPI001E32D1D2|nr:formate/nitrite transporter family protein [Kocuria sp. LUK]MCD1146043.1 formate/nitrite transporter family protein [Kocuria sp. LUK]